MPRPSLFVLVKTTVRVSPIPLLLRAFVSVSPSSGSDTAGGAGVFLKGFFLPRHALITVL